MLWDWLKFARIIRAVDEALLLAELRTAPLQPECGRKSIGASGQERG